MIQANPRFSIVIPCYNYAHSVGRAIESVLNQKDSSFELVVIDDGSSDNSPEVISHYTSGVQTKVRLICQENRGPAAVRNRGVDETCGDYLIFLDADDELAEGALSIFSEVVQEQPEAGLILGGHYTQHESGKRRYHSPGKLPEKKEDCFLAYLQKKLGMANGAVAMKREVFSKVSYNSKLRQSEDIPVFATAFANFPAVAVDRATACIYRHQGSLRSNTEWAEKMGYMVVNEVFSQNLPEACMKYARWYKSKKGLSLFRMYYKACEHQKAADYYHQAIKEYPANVFHWPSLSKFLRMRLKQLVIR